MTIKIYHIFQIVELFVKVSHRMSIYCLQTIYQPDHGEDLTKMAINILGEIRILPVPLAGWPDDPIQGEVY